MRNVEIAVHLLMLSVMAILLLGNLSENLVRERSPGFPTVLLVCDIFMLACGTGSLYMASAASQGLQPALFYYRLFACSSFALYFVVKTVFVFYLLSYIAARVPVPAVYGRIVAVICAVSAVCWCISVFNGMFYHIADGHGVPGSFYWIGKAGGYLVSGLLFFVVFRYRRAVSLQDFFIISSFVLLPVAASFLQQAFPAFSMQIAVSLSLLLVFDFLHLKQVRLLAAQEATLAEERASLLVSQIRPHFIFNVLNSIYVLCDKNPAAVKPVIGNFASYLRMNLDALEKSRKIPFEKELAYVTNYLNLEKMRFGDDLCFSLDIEEKDFMIPPVSIVPLVENAVKHGICKKKGGGKVTVATFREGERIVVQVSDDGAGFDEKNIPVPDDRAHVGLRNSRERLWKESRAEMQIVSEPGKGTCVKVLLPAGKERQA